MIATGGLYHFILKLCKVVLDCRNKSSRYCSSNEHFQQDKSCFSLSLPLSSLGEKIAWALSYGYEDAPIIPNLKHEDALYFTFVELSCFSASSNNILYNIMLRINSELLYFSTSVQYHDEFHILPSL
jgi:hypothetical protein